MRVGEGEGRVERVCVCVFGLVWFGSNPMSCHVVVGGPRGPATSTTQVTHLRVVRSCNPRVIVVSVNEWIAAHGNTCGA